MYQLLAGWSCFWPQMTCPQLQSFFWISTTFIHSLPYFYVFLIKNNFWWGLYNRSARKERDNSQLYRKKNSNLRFGKLWSLPIIRYYKHHPRILSVTVYVQDLNPKQERSTRPWIESADKCYCLYVYLISWITCLPRYNVICVVWHETLWSHFRIYMFPVPIINLAMYNFFVI